MLKGANCYEQQIREICKYYYEGKYPYKIIYRFKKEIITMDETMNETMMENTEVEETSTDVACVDSSEPEEASNDINGLVIAGLGAAGTLMIIGGVTVVKKAIIPGAKKVYGFGQRLVGALKAPKKDEEPVCEGDATEVDDEEVEAEEETE